MITKGKVAKEEEGEEARRKGERKGKKVKNLWVTELALCFPIAVALIYWAASDNSPCPISPIVTPAPTTLFIFSYDDTGKFHLWFTNG